MIKKLNNQGFSTVEIVIIVVVIVALASVGWLIYNNEHKATSSISTSSSVTNSTKSTTTTTAPASALNISSEFMTAITSKDAAKAISLSESGSSQLIDQATSAVAGSYTETTSTEKSGSVYVLYSLTNSKNKYARVTLQETNGTWQVSSFVYGSSQLVLVP